MFFPNADVGRLELPFHVLLHYEDANQIITPEKIGQAKRCVQFVLADG